MGMQATLEVDTGVHCIPEGLLSSPRSVQLVRDTKSICLGFQDLPYAYQTVNISQALTPLKSSLQNVTPLSSARLQVVDPPLSLESHWAWKLDNVEVVLEEIRSLLHL